MKLLLLYNNIDTNTAQQHNNNYCLPLDVFHLVTIIIAADDSVLVVLCRDVDCTPLPHCVDWIGIDTRRTQTIIQLWQKM